jgi:hypothetical protein
MQLSMIDAPPVYALSLWRPWPWTFLQETVHPKRIENRSRPPWRKLVGTRVAMHAAETYDWDRLSMIREAAPLLPDTCEVHPTGIVGAMLLAGHVTSCEQVPEGQRVWWIGPVAILVPRVVAFREPVPCPGAQGYWNIEARRGKDVYAAVLRQWREAMGGHDEQ